MCIHSNKSDINFFWDCCSFGHYIFWAGGPTLCAWLGFCVIRYLVWCQRFEQLFAYLWVFYIIKLLHMAFTNNSNEHFVSHSITPQQNSGKLQIIEQNSPLTCSDVNSVCGRLYTTVGGGGVVWSGVVVVFLFISLFRLLVPSWPSVTLKVLKTCKVGCTGLQQAVDRRKTV